MENLLILCQQTLYYIFWEKKKKTPWWKGEKHNIDWGESFLVLDISDLFLISVLICVWVIHV